MSVSSDSSPGIHLPQPLSDNSGSLPQAGASPQAQAPSGSDFSVNPALSQAPQAGDSSDELDKEWINKARYIVEQTKQDPFVQSSQLSKAKADYLRIRFNKHIKSGPERTA